MAQHVSPRYQDATAVLIGTGPSLTVDQVGLCRHAHSQGQLIAMGVNDAFRICDFLDHLYVADKRWIDFHRDTVAGLMCEKWCHYDARMDPDEPDSFEGDAYDEWQKIRTVTGDGLSVDRAQLHRGNHSGYQLVNLAYLLGCRTIILLGYDGRAGGQHFFGKHPTAQMQVETNFEKFNKNWQGVADQCGDLGLTIINATPGSSIPCFPRGELGPLLYPEYA